MLFPKRKKQSLFQTLKKHEDHPKKQVGGKNEHIVYGDGKDEYLMLICSCGELIVYDKIRVLNGDPFNTSTYGGDKA